MRRIELLVVLVACVVLSGCRDSDEAALAKAIRTLEQDIDRFGATMETEMINPFGPSKQLTNRINAMPDDYTRQKLRERLADYVYAIDLAKVPVDKYGRRGAFENYVRHFTDSGMYAECSPTFSETWRLRFRYLEWLRRQVEEVRDKRPYPDGLSIRTATDGRFAWRYERGKSKGRMEYFIWLDRYNGFTKSFEQTIGWWEGMLIMTERAYTDSAELDQVTARFEKFVGRKLRTLKQCEDDLYADKRYIYPIYVPTPEGIKDAWSTAEAEEMAKGKQKVPPMSSPLGK